MTNILKFILLLIFFSTGLSLADSSPWSVPDTIEGVWKTLNYQSGIPEKIVKVYVQRDTLFGQITEVIEKKNNVDQLCEYCTDSLKDVPLKGLMILWGCTKKGRSWTRGRYLDITNGKTYRCDVELGTNGDLKVFAYINRVFKIGRTYRWERIE